MWKLDRLVADITVEFAFAYGVFGFGYCNLFRWKSLRPPRDLVCLDPQFLMKIPNRIRRNEQLGTTPCDCL